MLLRVQQMKCPDNFWASTEERETRGLNWTMLRRSLPFPTLVQQVQIARHLYKGSSFIIRKKGTKVSFQLFIISHFLSRKPRLLSKLNFLNVYICREIKKKGEEIFGRCYHLSHDNISSAPGLVI